MALGRPKQDIHEDDKLTASSMTLNNHHRRTLDELAPQIGAASRSATAAKVLEAVERMLRAGTLTAEQIRLASLPEDVPRT